jgi:hypothetical protein
LKRKYRRPKPDGINEDFWEYQNTHHPEINERVFDPLGDDIIGFELELENRGRQWEAKAYRRAADMDRSRTESDMIAREHRTALFSVVGTEAAAKTESAPAQAEQDSSAAVSDQSIGQLVNTRSDKRDQTVSSVEDLEKELLNYFVGEDRTEAQLELTKGMAAAKQVFTARHAEENWKVVDSYFSSSTRPLQDEAILQYTKVRFEAVANVALGVIGKSISPQEYLDYLKRLTSSLCDLSIERLRPFEPTRPPHRARQHSRNTFAEIVRSNLEASVRKSVAERWRVYRDWLDSSRDAAHPAGDKEPDTSSDFDSEAKRTAAVVVYTKHWTCSEAGFWRLADFRK